MRIEAARLILKTTSNDEKPSKTPRSDIAAMKSIEIGTFSCPAPVRLSSRGASRSKPCRPNTSRCSDTHCAEGISGTYLRHGTKREKIHGKTSKKSCFWATFGPFLIALIDVGPFERLLGTISAATSAGVCADSSSLFHRNMEDDNISCVACFDSESGDGSLERIGQSAGLRGVFKGKRGQATWSGCSPEMPGGMVRWRSSRGRSY